MAHASRNVRKWRRLKRELTRVYKMLDIALMQRDQARMISGALETELRKYDSRIPDTGGTGVLNAEQSV